ncbi:MAG: hypothetical protein M1834_003244 [Cirrosporium novae-zelandiae]|nr:MAG: hypothetical protein M1834_003244 [Cirrosporium novae-zelandiae]
MDIYLVRIRERPDNTLYIERKVCKITAETYTAISHVWGEPSTIQSVLIDNIGPVQLSPAKKDILSILRRAEICGTSWFWMDLFCINQNPNPPISISDQLMAIPAIYKSSQTVKILVESPVCMAWAEKASRIADKGVDDIKIFNEEELRHSRKCPNLILMDPWFERLWTRQEGLYAMKLQVVILNPVSCTRLTTSSEQATRWMAEGKAGLRRNAVDTFIVDKFGYHGMPTKGNTDFKFYLDFVYKHHVDVKSYGGAHGPHSNYSPFGEAWRSGRRTTKTRDYVLAVFPDIKGYRAPPTARKLSFQELLSDAFEQLTGHSQRRRFYILPKVPSSMITATMTDRNRPWIFENPATITEAFDPFLGIKASLVDTPFDGSSHTNSFTVAQSINIKRIAFTREWLPELVKLWEHTADTIRHMIFAAPSGPCTVSSRIMQSHKDLLRRYLAHQFARSAVENYCSPKRFKGLSPHGVPNFENLEFSYDVFERELKQFLVCLVCGTTLRCASIILQTVEVAMVVGTGIADKEEMLALVNRKVMETKGVELMLVNKGFVDYQGLQVVMKGKNGHSHDIVVGRTIIPKPSSKWLREIRT